jgi:hypothetical protein
MFVKTGQHKKKQKNFFLSIFLIYLVAAIVNKERERFANFPQF